jgi:signal transduction histidine kinase
MEQVDGDQLTKITASDRRDELGLLHNSFSRMLKRLRKSEKERDKSIQQLLENERLVTAGRIVSGVAHEINNPLAGIQTALFTIAKKPEALDRYLPHIQNEVERISGIVTQLLDLSRSGEVVKNPTDTRALAEESLRICQMAVKGKQVELHLSESAPQTTLDCDARKIQQVILNLVINAADALEGKGEILLTTALAGGDFCYRVADTGPGVPSHLKEQIFTPFFTTKAAGKGTGIGLAFSLNTIEKHGGSLRLLDSETGACFEIRLPLNRQDSK